MPNRRTLSVGAVVVSVLGLWPGCGGATSPGASRPDGGTDGGADAGVPHYAACDGPGQCTTAVPGCCGVCGAPTLADVTGVNSSRLAELKAATCDQKNPICPACAEMVEPNLVGFCEAVRCVAHDVRKDDLSACKADTDCMLRVPGCCMPCQVEPFQLIAVAKARSDDYRAAVCSPTEGCPKCLAQLPDGYAATCGADHHCRVTQQAVVCPATVPADGLSCASEAVTCEYGDDVRPGCRTRATCTLGAWQVAVAGCPPLPGPGEKGCPATTPTGDCTSDGLQCSMGGDATCVCASCLGPCSITARWACAGPPTTPGCPSRAPLLGTACAQDALVCTYGPACAPMLSSGRRCTGGVWVDEPLACPA